MEWIRQILRRIKALVLPRHLDRDLEDEIAFHLAMREQKHINAGATAEDAHALSRRQFGNVTNLKEACRTMWTFHFWETVWQDVRFGLRTLRKSPALTLVAVLTLALGIGANVAIFSLTYQVLLSRLPVPHPEELVILRSPGPYQGHTSSDSGTPGLSFSYPVYKELQKGSPAFSGLLARFTTQVSVSDREQAKMASAELVSGNYFDVLGVHAALGRVLSAQDETSAGANPVAVLSYGYWTRQYAMNSSILNKEISVNGTALTVVGVSQADFTGVQVGQMPDIFVPVTMKAQMTPNWDGLMDHRDRWLALMGRLQPGVNRKKAEAVLQPFYHQILESDLPFMKYDSASQPAFLARKLLLDQGTHGRPVLEEYYSLPLMFLSGLVGLILLIACANLAGLLIAKGEARQGEIAVRLSLGAGRWRIVRQLVTENLLLATGGGLAGLWLAYGILRALAGPIEKNVGALNLAAQLDFKMLVFASGATIVTGVLFGLAPALRVVRVDPQATLQAASAKGAGGVANVRLRKWLMVSQVAMTVLLMAEAGLFTQSLLNLKRADLGVKADHLIQFSISPMLNRYTATQSISLADQLRRNLLALPGVRGVGLAEVPIFAGSNRTSNVTVEGYTGEGDKDMDVRRNPIGPGYFAAIGTPLLAGRELTESDGVSAPKVAVINQSMAKRFFAGRDPIGRHFIFGCCDKRPDIEIVGVVKDSKQLNARDESHPSAFVPYAQDQERYTSTSFYFYVRTAQDPSAMAATLRKTVESLDASLPVNNLRTLEQQLDKSMFEERAFAFLTLCLGGLAALLAAIGLYGVMAYMVARRTREIGIRIALGATRQGIAWMVLREVVVMASVGLGAGILLSFAAGRALGSFLFGVTPGNPFIMVLTAMFLIGVALLAGSLPARKAASLDPMVALRHE